MTKPLPILPHMPWNVKKLICDSTDTVTKLSLGSCSRDFHNLIKDTRISYYSLTFKIHTDRRVAKVTFAAEAGHEKPLQYRYSPDGHTVQKMRESNEERLVENGNFVEAAVDQFLKIFRNPRVSIREFTVSVKGYLEYEEKKTYIFERIQSYFRSLVHPIAVEKLVLIFDGTHKDILCILPHLKPKTLNSITLERPFSLIDRFRLADIDLRQVAETEQWRNAEQFTMNNFDFKLPIDKWSHFSYTSLEVNSLTADEAKDIYHTFVNNEKWQFCTIEYQFLNQLPLFEYFSRLGRHRRPDRWNDFQVTIPRATGEVTVKTKFDSFILYKC